MTDCHGRTIEYMRISVTDRCNFRCKYCMPTEITSIGHEEILRFEEIIEICRLAVSLGITRFKITGGEPLVRKGILSFLENLKNTPGVGQVTLTTNGLLLKEALPKLEEIGINGINISLDTVNPQTFHKITGYDQFTKVWDSILAAQKTQIPLKINCVPLKGINDEDFFDLVHLARDHALDVRFIEIMPIGHGRDYEGISSGELLERIASVYPDYQWTQEPHGNGPASYISIPGFRGSIGFIDAIHGRFCHRCNRIRLTADGFLKPCLYYEEGISLKEMLRNGSEPDIIRSRMQQSIYEKPSGHQFYCKTGETLKEKKNMSQIGG